MKRLFSISLTVVFVLGISLISFSDEVYGIIPLTTPIVIDLDSANWNDKIWPSTITVDGSGNIYIAAVQFPNPQNPSAPYNDPVTKIQKYSSSGNLLLTLPVTYSKSFWHGPASNAGDIAVDSSQNIYVLPHGDGSPWRIQKFSSTGSNMGTFASLSFSPRSLVIDSSDKIYVNGYGDNFSTDTDNHIKIFNTSGTTLQTINTGNNRGTLAVDNQGNIWLFDNTVIHKYDSSGNLLFTATTIIDYRHNEITGLAINSTGTVFAPNNIKSQINLFNSAGNFVKSFGAPGTGIGEFAAWNPSGGDNVSGPFDVDVDNVGNIYVAGYGDHRIQIFPPNYPDNSSLDTTSPTVTTSVNLAVFGNGQTTVTYNPPTALDNIGVTSGPTCDHPSGSLFSVGITTVTCTATDAAGNTGQSSFQIRVGSDTLSSNSVDFTNTLTGASNWGYPDYCGSWGCTLFQFPPGPDYKIPENFDSVGNSYVVLNSNNVGSGYNFVQKLDSSSNLIFQLGSAGISSDIGFFYNPEDVVVDSHDNFYVADRTNGRIQVFDEDGFYLFSITSGANPFAGDLYNLAIDTNDNLYAADNLNNQIIHVFSISFNAPIVPTLSSNQAIGQTTILGTCGLNFPNGNSVNYGAIIPNILSPEVTLNMTNSGSAPALLQIKGSDWKDVGNTPVMNVNQTHFNQTAFQNTYASKALLNATDGTVTNSFVPSELLQLVFQLEAILLNPSFIGTATQTMDFTVSC